MLSPSLMLVFLVAFFFYGTIAWICHLISSKASLESNIPAGLKNLVFDATNSGLKLKGNDLYQAINNNIDSSSLNAISTGLNTLKLLGSSSSCCRN